jgi:hypothetical protein
MNKTITNYTFNKTAKTITFPDYTTMKLEYFKLIVNVETNTIIYNFASNGKGGSLSGNVLTLDYDTSSMNNDDKLMIVYENSEQDVYGRMISLLEIISKNIQLPQNFVPLASGPAQRVLLDSNSVMSSMSTISVVSTVGTMNQFNGLDSRELLFAQWASKYNEGIRSKIN